MLSIKPRGAPGCQCKAILAISWSDTHSLLSSLGWFSSPVLKWIMRVCSEISFWSHTLKTLPYCCHCSVVTCLQPTAVLLSLPHVWHSCFVSFCGWFEAGKPEPPTLSRTGGLPSPRGACAALGGHSFVFNYSESISSVLLETVHDPCFSLARVLCWGEASACCFSAATKECFLLPLPSQSPQTLPLPWERCFGTGHWNFRREMFSCLSMTGISFFLITGVRCWSDWQIHMWPAQGKAAVSLPVVFFFFLKKPPKNLENIWCL